MNDNEGKDILAESDEDAAGGQEPENPFLDSDQPEDNPSGPDQLNPVDPLDPPNDESSVDTDQVDADADENPVDTMVTKEPMSEIIKNEEVYLAQEQDDQVKRFQRAALIDNFI